MKSRIQGDGRISVDARLRAHVERRLDFTLSAFADRVGRIVVKLSHDAPAGTSGVGRAARATRASQCVIEVTLRPRSVQVSDTGSDAFAAVENAAERLALSIGRALERERAWAVDGAPAAPPLLPPLPSPAAPPPPRRRRR